MFAASDNANPFMPNGEKPNRPIEAPQMNNMVVINGRAESIDSDIVRRFIVDVARVWEMVLPLELVQARYDLSDRAWAKLAEHDALVKAVREEMVCRTFNDSAAKERAQLAWPEMLENILTDNTAPARNRIEASKELRAYAHSGKDEQAADRDRFHIVIDLTGGGGERLEYNMPLKPIEPMEGEQPTIDISDDDEANR